MIKKLLLSFTLLYSVFATAQVGLIESFNTGLPAGWTVNGAGFFASNAQACDGQSIRANVWTANGGTTITSPNFIGASNATDLSFEFEYKLVDWSAATNPTATGWGTMNVEYSTDGGVTWINIDTIDDDNHVTSATCATKSYTIAAADLPDGSDFQFRIDVDWVAGDYYVYLDNVIALQTTTEVPNCDAALILPADGATDVEIETGLAWSAASGLPSEYFLTVGTTPGGNDVVDSVSTGLATSYAFAENLAYATTYYVTILPANENGNADTTACSEFTFTTEDDPSVVVDCTAGPLNDTLCYGNGENATFVFTSNDGTPLNFTINSGNIELFFDDLIIFDSDGSVLYDVNAVNGGFGNFNLAGLTFQSSGDSISFLITSDGSVSCASSAAYLPIDYTVSCATCVNPQASFELVTDCLNAPQFFIDVDVTDLGSATSLEVSDSEGVSTVTVTEVGVVQVGPFPNGTNVTVDVLNLDDSNCAITSGSFTQEFCTLTEIDCSQPFDGSFCYTNNEDTTLEFVSEDGSPLNFTINAGNIELNFDDFIIFDTDGTVLYDVNEENDGFGNFNLAGLTFQSTGDTISFLITSDGSVSCESSAAYLPIDYTVSCATCINPQATFELVNDCLNAPQFFIDVNVTSLGDATSLEITDSEGVSTETVTETGIVQVGPFPNGTLVTVDIQSLDDANCSITSDPFTQEFCTLTEVSCDAPFNESFCYGNGEDITFEFVSEDGIPLNFIINSGNIELNFDDFIVFDSDGTVLYDVNVANDGFGNFDLSGLSFQSTGDSISFSVSSDGSVSCESSAAYLPIDYTVTCATCINPQASYTILDNCTEDVTDYFIEVNIDSLGDATSLLVSSDQGDTPQVATEVTSLTFGPYEVGNLVTFTIANQDDANCTITSTPQGVQSCDCFAAEPFCAPTDGSPLVFDNVSDGSSAPPGIDYDCLGSQPDPVWFYLVVEESGDLDFQIVQSTQLDDAGFPDQNNGLIDVDFLVWGPFDDPANGCSNLVPETQVDCSFSAAPIEQMFIPGAVAGEVYVVLITNFNGSPGFISLGQTNFGEPGGGSTNCDFIFTEYGCASDGVLLSSEVEDGNAYQWFILDDPDSDPEDTSNYVPVENGEGQEYLALQSGSYFVLSQAQDNTFGEEFFTVQLSETPEIALELTQNICEGEVLSMDATPTNSDNYDAISYQWFDLNGEIAGATGSVHEVTQTGLYEVHITTEELLGSEIFECTTVFQINVQGAEFEVDLGGNQFFCDAFEPIVITAEVSGLENPEADISYAWSTGETTPSIEVTESDIYSVTVTVEGCSKTVEAAYVFNTVPQIGVDTTITTCEFPSEVVDVTPSNSNEFTNLTYQWSDESGVIEGATSSEFSFAEPGVYSVEVLAEENQLGVLFECATTFEFNVIGADFEVDLGEAQAFCDETEPQTISVNLSGIISPDASITYAWSNGDTSATTQVSETGTYSVVVTVDGCVEEAQVTYTFNVSPIIDIPSSIESCDLSNLILDATPQNADAALTTYVWSYEGEVLVDEVTQLVLADDYGFGTYQVTAFTNDETCLFTQEIEVSPRFVSVNLTTDSFDNLFCPGEEVSIVADVVGADDDTVTYTWFVNGVAQTPTTNAEFVYEIGSDASNPMQDVISVSVNVGGDCVSETEEVILERYPLDNCIIPEGMSPDGVNHTLDLRFLADRSGIRSLEIFNRFGRSVFKQNNYTNEFIGQNQNGSKLVTGTYFYVIKFAQEDPVYGREHKGWIYLNREQQ